MSFLKQAKDAGCVTATEEQFARLDQAAGAAWGAIQEIAPGTMGAVLSMLISEYAMRVSPDDPKKAIDLLAIAAKGNIEIIRQEQ